MKKPIVLMILDGYGIRKEPYGNAIRAAKTPVMDKLMATCPNTTLGASGLNVGLPDGQMGNSEVGHTNIGAGRIVYQELTRITKSIHDGDFFQNEKLLLAMENCKNSGTALHLIGLLSHGGVHSHDTHLYAILELAKKSGLEKVFVHCLTDGRDVPPKSGADSLRNLEAKMKEIGVGKVATVIGRYYAMDRDNRWDRVQLAYNAMVYGEGIRNPDPTKAIEASYKEEITDEFIKPTICAEDGKLKKKDSVIFFNFRPDRAREITRAFVDPAFEGFAPVDKALDLTYICMTQYDSTMPNVEVAFKPQTLEHTFGEYISNKGLKQLRIAETEKYPHVTFFFNGGVEKVYPGEDRALIPSPKVATYDLQPEMSACEVTAEMLKRLETKTYDVIILNYANCDMVGHTGFLDAAIKAVETVDECLGKVVAKVTEMGGVVLITADHGNAEQMYEPDGSPFTAHTTNPVPCVVVGLGNDIKLMPEGQGKLADLSPTMLKIMNFEQPKEMTGSSIIL